LILLEIRMKYILSLALLFATTLVACGGSTGSTQTSSNPGTGTWVESLSTTSGQQLGSFTFNMTQNNVMLTGGNMNFSNMGDLSQCFGTGTVMNGQMGPGMMNGGTMNMTMSWTPQGSTATNTMVMQGTMANGMSAGSGTFVLTGQSAGCTSQTGRFTMNPEPA
jgi:hypothetical protein